MDSVDSSLLVHSFHPALSDPAGLPRWSSRWHLEGAIRSMCAHASAFVVSQERALQRENFTPTERERQVSVCKGEHVCHYVGIRGGGREGGRVAFPHGRLSLGMASSEKVSFLLSIRSKLSLYFGPNHLQRKPQENATLEFLNTGSDQFLLTQTCRLL